MRYKDDVPRKPVKQVTGMGESKVELPFIFDQTVCRSITGQFTTLMSVYAERECRFGTCTLHRKERKCPKSPKHCGAPPLPAKIVHETQFCKCRHCLIHSAHHYAPVTTHCRPTWSSRTCLASIVQSHPTSSRELFDRSYCSSVLVHPS